MAEQTPAARSNLTPAALEARRQRLRQREREVLKYTRICDPLTTPPEAGIFTIDPIHRKTRPDAQSNGEAQSSPDADQSASESTRPKKRKRGRRLEKIEIPKVEPDEYGRVLGVIWPYCTHIYGGNAHSLDPFGYFPSEHDHYYYEYVDDDDTPELKEGETVSILMKKTQDEVEEEKNVEAKEDEKPLPWYKRVDPEKYKKAYTVYRPSEFKKMEEVAVEIEERNKPKRRRLNPKGILNTVWNAAAAVFKFLTSKMQD